MEEKGPTSTEECVLCNYKAESLRGLVKHIKNGHKNNPLALETLPFQVRWRLKWKENRKKRQYEELEAKQEVEEMEQEDLDEGDDYYNR